MKLSFVLVLAFVCMAGVALAQEESVEVPGNTNAGDASTATENAATPSNPNGASTAGATPANPGAIVPAKPGAAAPSENSAENSASGLPSAESAAALPENSPDAVKLSSSIPDPLNLGAAPPMEKDVTRANTMPPFSSMNSEATVSPNLVDAPRTALDLNLSGRIKQTEDLLNRMVWQLNRETSWANSVHDIIQNYQYKYSKVLANIKQHTESVTRLRDLSSRLKKAKLHETLESDLNKATRELTELAASSSETSEDDGSYASLKDRVALMKQDLEKMNSKKVHTVLHGVQDELKQVAADAIPPPSGDTLGPIMDSAKKA